jgi:F0F1-type ATP synthase assembly protein I
MEGVQSNARPSLFGAGVSLSIRQSGAARRKCASTQREVTMSPPSAETPSYTLEIIIGTCVGATVGLLADNLILGTGVGIALGCLLSVIKVTRMQKKDK